VNLLDYSNIKKVISLYSEDDVNEKLENGWVLLGVNAESDKTSSTTKYVLGWKHSESEEEYISKKTNMIMAFKRTSSTSV
jgi:hypothetical protein